MVCVVYPFSTRLPQPAARVAAAWAPQLTYSSFIFFAGSMAVLSFAAATGILRTLVLTVLHQCTADR